MKRTALIAFLFVTHSCLGQISSDYYILTLNFAPSFMGKCKLMIKKSTQDTIKLTFKDFSKKEIQDQVFVSNTRLEQLTNLLKTYKFQLKSNIDTIGSHTTFKNCDSVTWYDVNMGNDGITVDGSLNKDNNLKKFAFWSPNKGTENAKFMNVIFNILERSFSKDSDINYIEALRDYFPHGLIVRKMSRKPIKYKWYGNSNEDQEDDLDKFLSALPKNQPVYIDVSQFAIAPIIDDDLANNKNIYWVNPNKYMLRELQNAEISKRHIIYSPQKMKAQKKALYNKAKD
jgi:hypothetical protein